jgi:HAD superfamily hydrolase (TIGR01549 family)
MIRLVLFDLDGTLIEFNYNYALAKKIVISKLVEMGVERNALSESKPASVNLEEAVSLMRRKGVDESFLRRLRRTIYEAVEPLELDAAERPVLKNGVWDVLTWLRGMRIDMSVCTNNCKRATNLILYKTGLEKFFKNAFTRDDVARLKPFPDLILKACEALEKPPNETVHVGDSPIDIAAAKEAGAIPIGVDSGLWGLDKLREAGAEHVASDMRELKAILLSLIRSL